MSHANGQPLGRNHLIALALCLLLAVGLGWRTYFKAGDPLSYYAPDAYVERANQLIRDGYLKATCFGRQPKLELDMERAPASDRAWYEESYLAGDVARFNADPAGWSWTFQIDRDCRLVGVNPAVHNIDLPFHRRLAWLGTVYYSGGSAASLRSPRREIELQPAMKPTPVERSAATEVGKNQDVFAEGSVLLTLPGGRARQAASIFFVGDRMVAQNGLGGPEEELRLMGHKLPMGRFARLDTGDWLAVESKERGGRRQEVFVYKDFEPREPASVVRRQNDQNRRRSDDPGLGQIPDPARSETYPYLDQLAKSVSNALAVLPEAESRALADGFDLQLSIERKTQLEVSRTFRDHCGALRKQRNLEPFSGGVTVMDGLSGKVLAMATYPPSEELEGIELGERQQRRLLQNQNLVLHAIGSAGKPFLFASVADAFPPLLELEIAGHAPERYYPDLFQCRLPLGYQLLEGHGDDRIDFARALEISCNKYTVELLTLSLAAHWARHQPPPPGAGDLERLIPRDRAVAWPKAGQSSGVFIGGERLDYAPYLAGFVSSGSAVNDPARGSVLRCSTLGQLDRAGFAGSLEHLTGAATYFGRNPGLVDDPNIRDFQTSFFADAYDLRPWKKLVARVARGHEKDEASLKVRTALHAVAPERTNLALNQLTRLRGDFISLALGGGTSLWTNLQLAEAISRLASGRAVEAELASTIFERGQENAAQEKAEPAALLQLKAEAREAVLEGMRRVVEGERGTARVLLRELDKLRAEFPQDTLAIYSKTGSPILDKPVPPVTGEALEKLVQKGRLVWTGKLGVRLQSGREATWAARNQSGRPAWEQAFGEALGEIGYGSSRWLRQSLLRAVDRSAEALARPTGDDEANDDLDPALAVDGAGLKLNRDSGLFRNESVKSLAGVYVFTLIKLPGEAELPPSPADLADPRAKMLSVAIHLEAGEGSEDAVAVARVLLPKLKSLLADTPAEG
jgi:cell division protein FtsI/penicillin-binding protein 2